MRIAAAMLLSSGLLLVLPTAEVAEPQSIETTNDAEGADDGLVVEMPAAESALVEVATVEAAPEEAVAAPTGRSFLATLTAYSYESCANPARCRTRTGTIPRFGTVAVDPSVIPLGSQLTIEGFETIFVAEDTGGGVRGQHVDIWFGSTRDALAFGRQRGVVTVLQ